MIIWTEEEHRKFREAWDKADPNQKFQARLAEAQAVLSEDRRRTILGPSGLPWADRSKKAPKSAVRKERQPRKVNRVVANAVVQQARDAMVQAFEGFTDSVANLVTVTVALKLEAAGSAIQQKTERAEGQLRQIRDVRRDLIAAKAEGRNSDAERLAMELKMLQDWAATGQRAAAEVGA